MTEKADAGYDAAEGVRTQSASQHPDWSECPCLPLPIDKNDYNGFMSIRTRTREPWKKMAWSDESGFTDSLITNQVDVRCLPGEEMAPGCTMRRKQAFR